MYAATAPRPSPNSILVERHHDPRRRVLKGGFVSFNDRHSDFPCTVRGNSAASARLKVKDGFNFPSRFELLIELDGLEAHSESATRPPPSPTFLRRPVTA